MYTFVLALHNIIRWLVLIFGLLVVIRAFIGWFGSREWSDLDNKLGLGFVASLDSQLILGLLLYFVLSPLTTSNFSNFGEAMSNSAIRFFLVEHMLMMIIAVVLGHVGRALSKRAEDDAGKFKRAAIFYTISLLVILASIPWFRPLLPF